MDLLLNHFISLRIGSKLKKYMLPHDTALSSQITFLPSTSPCLELFLLLLMFITCRTLNTECLLLLVGLLNFLFLLAAILSTATSFPQTRQPPGFSVHKTSCGSSSWFLQPRLGAPPVWCCPRQGPDALLYLSSVCPNGIILHKCFICHN